LLYEVTQSPPHDPSASRVLGPTAGVRQRTSGVETLVFRKDPTNGGGAFVTSDPRLAAELKELPKGLIITETSTPASGMEDASRHPGKTPETADGSHQNGINEASSSSLESMNIQDQDASRGDSMPTAHPTGSYLPNQGTNSTPPSDAVLESIPSNLFDWGKLFVMRCRGCSDAFTGGWERWLQTLGSDPYTGLPAGIIPQFSQ
jgi:hypothetical protein